MIHYPLPYSPPQVIHSMKPMASRFSYIYICLYIFTYVYVFLYLLACSHLFNYIHIVYIIHALCASVPQIMHALKPVASRFSPALILLCMLIYIHISYISIDIYR